MTRIDYKRDAGFGLLFNFYFRMGKYDWAKSVALSAKEKGMESATILRNLARAYQELGETEAAQEGYKYAIEQHPNDDTTYAWYGGFLDDLGKYELAYDNTERAVIADPDDGSRYISLGIQILNRGYVRRSNGDLVGPVEQTERLKHAVPLFSRAIEISEIRYLDQITSVLVRANAVKIAQQFYDNAIPLGDYDSTSLNVLLEKIQT